MGVSKDWQQSELFRWTDYPRALHAAIVRCRYASERLTRCSVCGKRRVLWGVVIHPHLKMVEPPAGLQVKPYALCALHGGMTVEEIGAVVYQDAWAAPAPSP